MINAFITRLGSDDHPWLYALHIQAADRDQFDAFISDLKRHIPHRDRKWDPASKRWFLRDTDVVIYLLERHKLKYWCDDAPPPTNHRPRTLDRAAALRLLHLQADAPEWMIQAAYRAAAKKLHPDAGGSTEDMQAVNAAMEALR